MSPLQAFSADRGCTVDACMSGSAATSRDFWRAKPRSRCASTERRPVVLLRGWPSKQRDDEQDSDGSGCSPMTGLGPPLPRPGALDFQAADRLDRQSPRNIASSFWRSSIFPASTGIAPPSCASGARRRTWTSGNGEERRTALRSLMAKLVATRRFGAGGPVRRTLRQPKTAGLHKRLPLCRGLLQLVGPRDHGSSIHLRQDDRPLLELLAGSTGLGKVDRAPARRSAQPVPRRGTSPPAPTWPRCRDLLRAGAAWSGRKRREMEVWACAVDELIRAARPGGRPQRELLDTGPTPARWLERAYRPPGRPELLRLPARDLRTDSLNALIAWSRETIGSLPCTGYMRWRREQPEAPARATIVRPVRDLARRAGAAAGLGDRVARAPRPIGGEAGRAARREQQRSARARVRCGGFEREPAAARALEFFRWRYEAAVDAPTHVRCTVPQRFSTLLDRPCRLPIFGAARLQRLRGLSEIPV